MNEGLQIWITAIMSCFIFFMCWCCYHFGRYQGYKDWKDEKNGEII